MVHIFRRIQLRFHLSYLITVGMLELKKDISRVLDLGAYVSCIFVIKKYYWTTFSFTLIRTLNTIYSVYIGAFLAMFHSHYWVFCILNVHLFVCFFFKWSEIAGMDGQNSREVVTCLPVSKPIGRKLRLWIIFDLSISHIYKKNTGFNKKV